MSEHLSSLALDEAATGAPFEAADRDHLAGCAQCQTAVQERQALNARLLATPQAQAMRARLLGRPVQQQPAAVARATLVRRVVLTALPLAAAIGLFFTAGFQARPDDGDRIKGSVSVGVLLDGRLTGRAKVGAKVTVAVGAAGHGLVSVFAFDPASSSLEPLFPSDGSLTAAPKGASAPVGAPLEVTPGTTRVVAVFADSPAAPEAIRAAALAHVRGQPLPPTFWAASASLEVEPK